VDSGTTATYVYDAIGQRAQATTTHAYNYIYDQSGRAITQLYSGGWVWSELYAGSKHVATYASGLTFFDLQDLVSSERVKMTQNGASYESTASLPFGDDVTQWGNEVGGAGSARFTGDLHDSESNLEHTLFRQYSSTQGRWLSPDPSGMAAADPTNPQTWNRYAYVGNSPLNNIDPLGLLPPPPTDPGNGTGCAVNEVPVSCEFADSLGGGGGALGAMAGGGSLIACPGNTCLPYDFNYGGNNLANLLANFPSTWQTSTTGTDYMLLLLAVHYTDDPAGDTFQIGDSVLWADLGPISMYQSIEFGQLGTLPSPGNNGSTAIIGPPQNKPAKQSTWTSNYTTQLGCQLGAISAQGEPIVGSAVASLVFAASGRYVVSGAFLTAYIAQLVKIRNTCGNLAWGPK
jgi:RHS repeat-associated protein